MAIMTRPLGQPHVPHVSSAGTPLRRCTFRRVTSVSTPRELPVYDVACMFPERKRAIPLGDIEDARPICESCTYQGIFRPDSD